MKTLFLASAAALTMMAAPAAAQVSQDAPLGSTNTVADKRTPMTAEQRAVYDAMTPEFRADFDTWENDRRVLYFGWDAALRDYYLTLDDRQQDAWWYLDGEQQVTLFQLQGADRDAAWNSVLTQVARMEQDREATATATTTAHRADQRGERMEFTSNAVVQQVASHSGEYPVCESESDDHCINPWAAGQRGPGADRPLDYWPGRPASEGQLGG